jgi:hypothetical protein
MSGRPQKPVAVHRAFKPSVPFLFRTRLHIFAKLVRSHDKRQGTTSVVSIKLKKRSGFSLCGTVSNWMQMFDAPPLHIFLKLIRSRNKRQSTSSCFLKLIRSRKKRQGTTSVVPMKLKKRNGL